MPQIYMTEDKDRKPHNKSAGVFIFAGSLQDAQAKALTNGYKKPVTGPVPERMLESADPNARLIGHSKRKTLGSYLALG